MFSFFVSFTIFAIVIVAASASPPHTHNNEQQESQESQNNKQKQWLKTRLSLWTRGDIHGKVNIATLSERDALFINSDSNFWKLGPVRNVRSQMLDATYDYSYNVKAENDCIEFECHTFNSILHSLRGGGVSDASDDASGGTDTDTDAGGTINYQQRMKSYNQRLKVELEQLAVRYGAEFQQAIELNEKEHAHDCEISCQSFYCASSTTSKNNTDTNTDTATDTTAYTTTNNETAFLSYNFGAVPPEDFAQEFGFPLDIIKVSQGQPLFTSEEASNVIQTAEQEGVDKNEYQSGKYKLGGDWLVNLPKTRTWFNHKLQSTFFPLLAQLFPEIVSSTSVLRAHSVSLLKYNSSHPRTDVHIDNGILAITVAMTPQDDYVGGGTFFEHMPQPIQMDVGHITVRPGSVRHGGHKVTQGTRYILGAFLLIKDRVEHVRRLKNRGSELRRKQDLTNAAKHFEWALAINPQCTTCLKDWAEILMAQKQYDKAEIKIREALRLLENRDSDALFSLGVILSATGKDDESIDAYRKSVELNADDAELCYNLGIKLGERGDQKAEMIMYARATQADPKFGGAWLNWGTTLAESGNIDDVSVTNESFITCLQQMHHHIIT